MKTPRLPRRVLILAAFVATGLVAGSKAQEQVDPRPPGGTFFSGNRTTNRLNDGTRDSMTLRDRAAIPPRGTGRVDRSPVRVPSTTIIAPPMVDAGARSRANASTIQSRNRAGDTFRSRLRANGPVVIPSTAIPDAASQFGLQRETPEKGMGIQSVTAAKPAAQSEDSLPVEVISDNVADRLNPTTLQNVVNSNSGASNGALIWQSRATILAPEESPAEIESLRNEVQALHAELETLRNE